MPPGALDLHWRPGPGGTHGGGVVSELLGSTRSRQPEAVTRAVTTIGGIVEVLRAIPRAEVIRGPIRMEGQHGDASIANARGEGGRSDYDMFTQGRAGASSPAGVTAMALGALEGAPHACHAHRRRAAPGSWRW